MPVDRRLGSRRLWRLASRTAVLATLAATSLSATGCGLAAGLLTGLITDAINGSNGDGGDPTVLLVGNEAGSTEAIVEIDVVRIDGAHAPYTYPVNTAPGAAASLKDVFDAGAHSVRVVYASGWRSQSHAVDIVKDGTVTTKFVHAAPDLSLMAGTWFGSAANPLGVSITYAFTLDVAGHASTRTIDGVADAATGTLTETSEGVYRVTWSGATVSALVADDAHAHAGLVADDGTVGALQKGATGPLPTGTNADVVGTWIGTEVHLVGAPLAPGELDAANATVSAQQHWIGNDAHGDGTVGVTPLVVLAPTFLRYECDAEDDAPTPLSLNLGMWLTADRTYGFVVLAPAAGGAFPDSGVFQLLKKSP